MDKKKKPPPGATLLSRLKEGRLRREQELLDRGIKRNEPGAVSSAAQANLAKPSAPGKPGAPVKPAGRANSSQPSAVKPKIIEIKPVDITEPDTTAAPVSTPPKAAVTTDAVAVRVIESKGKQVDFIHRSISIDDLRPVSDEYDLLTEEIRLAGRFAAAGLIAQGLRLARLKDDNIYQNHYPAFEEYCRTEHSMSATYAYRLIRMAEMAERLAEEGPKQISSKLADAMPDPFEVMLGLGHRHLLALLPLEIHDAEEFLLKGVPIATVKGKGKERIPIVKATEQQIREAIKLYFTSATQAAVKRKKPTTPTARSVRTLSDIIELMQDWTDWLEGQTDSHALADRIGERAEANKLARKFRSLSERLAESLAQVYHK